VVAKPPSPTAWLPLVRLAALQGLMNVRLAESLGSPHPPRPRRFRRDLRFPPNAVPRWLALTGSSPRELHSSSESSRSTSAVAVPGAGSFLGVAVPPRDITDWRPCLGNPSSLGLSVLGVSHARDGLLRHPARGFISPHSHVQGSPFREFPSRTADSPRRRFVPSRRWRRRAAPVARSATRRRPALRALIRARVRGVRGGV